MKRFSTVFLFLFLSPGIMIELASGQVEKSCNFCFRGKPSPKCCSFLIFESGMLGSKSSQGAPKGAKDYLFTGDIGLMFNRSGKSALGGSFHLAGDEDGLRFGLGPRYRKWISHKIGFDISPRLMFGGSNNQVHRRFPGFSLSASISFMDLISLDGYYHVLPYEEDLWDYSNPESPFARSVKDTETRMYIGWSGRSYLAPVVASVFLMLVALSSDEPFAY
jgi:hypothetical protein